MKVTSATKSLYEVPQLGRELQIKKGEKKRALKGLSS